MRGAEVLRELESLLDEGGELMDLRAGEGC